VFRLTRASKEKREKLLAAARQLPPSSPNVLTLADGLVETLPRGFAHDLSRSQIGQGQNAFAATREAFQKWEQFSLGWVRIANPIPKVAPGELVAVEAHTACLWSINFSRIVEIVDSPTRFGFMYTTTALHIEEGQERFLVEFELESGSVHYLIEAISRPRHILARVGYPFSRATQHRFARDSHARMGRCVLEAADSRAQAKGGIE
jgi:uncharacterized protein (UPF0548 family)